MLLYLFVKSEEKSIFQNVMVLTEAVVKLETLGTFRFYDEDENMDEIFSYNNIELAQTSVILGMKNVIPSSFFYEVFKNVVASKQVKNTVAGLAFFAQQKGSVTSNKNN